MPIGFCKKPINNLIFIKFTFTWIWHVLHPGNDARKKMSSLIKQQSLGDTVAFPYSV